MKKSIVVSFIAIVLIVLPYLFAAVSTQGNSIFGGFLLNPKDGNSYLAKMYEGYQGEWLFTLPFNVAKGNGHLLFTFYLFLGHLAKWFHLPLIWVFHIARIGSAGFLLWAVSKFSACLFPDSKAKADLFFLITTLGSGMGWLLFSFGIMTSDLWVAEAYPFLSMYVNPHFPLGLALMLCLLIDSAVDISKRQLVRLSILGVLLSIILPFGIVIIGMILGIRWLWNTKTTLKFQIPLDLLAILPGGFWVGVQYLLPIKDPMLKVWNQQNLTPTPLIWDWIVSFSPALLLMFVALNKAKFEENSNVWKDTLIWVAAATIIQVIPFNLQRRFLLGFYIPLVAYAVQAIFLVKKKVRKWLIPVVIAISLPTNILVIALGFFASQTQAVELYIRPSENQAYEWIINNTGQDAVILSSPETGARIPGRTGRRVVYGHDFETVNSAEMKTEVEAFFKSPTSEDQLNWANKNNVDFIYVGNQERNLMGEDIELSGIVVYRNDEVNIYQLRKP
jgi:predicted membrane protein